MTSSTDPLGYQTQYAYDPFGDLTQVTDPKGNSLSMTYDANHNLSAQTSTADNLQVGYTYDGDGNVTQVKETSSNGSTTYATNTSSYNNLDQQVSSTDALGKQTTYTYDPNGNLSSMTLPDGHTVSTTYDNAGESTAVSVDGTTVNQFDYNAAGDITSISNSNGSTTFGHDNNGNITSQTDSTGSQSFTYNKDNALTTLAATVGSTTLTTNFNLDSQDSVTSITDGSGSQLAQYNYNEQGLNDTVVLGNGLKEAFRYDGNLRLKSLVIENSASAAVGDYEYSYDADGNLTKVVNGQDGSTIASYGYDAMNRLTTEVTPSGDTVTYTYDPMGNILSKAVQPSGSSTSTTTNYTYNADNQLTAVNSQAFTYDANGNLTSSGSDTYKWNELGELTEVDNSSGTPIAIYTYDALGRRVSETAGGTTTKFFYQSDSNQVTYETDGSGNLLQSYTYGANGSPLTLTTWSGGAGTTYYYQENGHGDVVALTDTSGTIVAQYTYDAWGNILSSTGTLASTNPYLYAGYRWDSAVGMYYLNARYYAPSLMRFISRDPLGGLSPYVYADDNPVKEVDPNGTWALDAMWLVLDVASFAANPSWGGAAWIAGDLASFADPTGVASTAIHAAKIARSADRLAETYRAASKFYEATKGTVDAAQQGEHTVYTLRDPITNDVKYVGRTKNPIAREATHKANNEKAGLVFTPEYSGLSYQQARGLEQILFENNGGLSNLINRINPISPKNDNISTYLNAARDYLGTH
ncbi:RHS repeat-associated core domain-containing protein [Alicyclobacillus sp. ALC3]|uniref:RHS repeat-associated core domain-containing protein n=1 Tax=Alicyclobacillus sp. ALC3 TaxID=2796143 RepID=UPI00279840F3|nr:hypothetical protein JC200_14020 [Alicyclobacillus sp. ALC3]